MSFLPELTYVQLTAQFAAALGVPALLQDRMDGSYKSDGQFSLSELTADDANVFAAYGTDPASFAFDRDEVFTIEPVPLAAPVEPIEGAALTDEVPAIREENVNVDGYGIRSFAVDNIGPPSDEPLDVAAAAETPMSIYEMDQGTPDIFADAIANEPAQAVVNLLGFDISSTQPIEGWVNALAEPYVSADWSIWGDGATAPSQWGSGWW